MRVPRHRRSVAEAAEKARTITAEERATSWSKGW